MSPADEIPGGLIPRSVLFGDRDRVNPMLSPDGTQVAWAAPADGTLNIWAEPLDGSGTPRLLTRDHDRGISKFVLCHDGRHLVYLQDHGAEDARLYAVDLRTGGTRQLTPPGACPVVLGHDRHHPGVLLVALTIEDVDPDPDTDPWLSSDGASLFVTTAQDADTVRLVRLDAVTGELTVLAEDPGHDLADVWTDPETREPLVAVF